MSAPCCSLPRAPPSHGTPGRAGPGAEAGLGVDDVADAVMAGAAEAAGRGGAPYVTHRSGGLSSTLCREQGNGKTQKAKPQKPFSNVGLASHCLYRPIVQPLRSHEVEACSAPASPQMGGGWHIEGP